MTLYSLEIITMLVVERLSLALFTAVLQRRSVIVFLPTRRHPFIMDLIYFSVSRGSSALSHHHCTISRYWRICTRVVSISNTATTVMYRPNMILALNILPPDAPSRISSDLRCHGIFKAHTPTPNTQKKYDK